VDVVVM